MSERAFRFWLRACTALLIASSIFGAYMQAGVLFGFLDHGENVPAMHVLIALALALSAGFVGWRGADVLYDA